MIQIKQMKSPHHCSRYGQKPCLIVWHIADGTYNGTVAWECNPNSSISSHYVLGENGEITQLVPLTEAAYTQGVVKKPTHPLVKMRTNVNPNLYCVSIECAGYWSKTKGKLTEKQLQAAAELTKHIVAEVKRIYGTTISIDREHMIGHCEINTVTRPHCPGELFQYDELISMANGKAPHTGGQTAQNTPPAFTDELPYTVQVGAFADRVNAGSMQNKLSGMGYYAFVTGVNSTNRVCVGKFKDKPTAQRTADDLKKKGIAGFVTTI